MKTKPSYKELAKQVNELETELKQVKDKMVTPSCPFELSKVIDQLHTVSVKDENGIYLFINQPFTDKFGLTENDILGKTDYDLLSKEEADLYRKEDLLILETGESIERENELFGDGKKQYFILRKFLVSSIEGSDKFVGVIGIDITIRNICVICHLNYPVSGLTISKPGWAYYKRICIFVRVRLAIVIQ